MGCIRMSYGDFCRLTLEEFRHIYDAYRQTQETEYRNEWERTRMLASIAIQPHVKKKIEPRKLLPFPWEKRKAARPLSTAAEDRARLENLMRRLNG